MMYAVAGASKVAVIISLHNKMRRQQQQQQQRRWQQRHLAAADRELAIPVAIDLGGTRRLVETARITMHTAAGAVDRAGRRRRGGHRPADDGCDSDAEAGTPPRANPATELARPRVATTTEKLSSNTSA